MCQIIDTELAPAGTKFLSTMLTRTVARGVTASLLPLNAVIPFNDDNQQLYGDRPKMFMIHSQYWHVLLKRHAAARDFAFVAVRVMSRYNRHLNLDEEGHLSKTYQPIRFGVHITRHRTPFVQFMWPKFYDLVIRPCQEFWSSSHLPRIARRNLAKWVVRCSPSICCFCLCFISLQDGRRIFPTRNLSIQDAALWLTDFFSIDERIRVINNKAEIRKRSQQIPIRKLTMRTDGYSIHFTADITSSAEQIAQHPEMRLIDRVSRFEDLR